MIKPEIRVFIEALKRGSGKNAAFRAYCFAKSVVPIIFDQLSPPQGDPMLWPSLRNGVGHAQSRGEKAFKDGKSETEIQEAFLQGIKDDVAYGDMMFRPMTKEERDERAFEALVSCANAEERLLLAGQVGMKPVAYAMLNAKT